MLNLQSNSVFGLENIPFFKKGSKIHIKKENRGKFTKSAKAAGESVQEHAAKVLRDPNATPLQKKRANFARNAAKWKHLFGGTLMSNVDTRSDTTFKGYHEGLIPYGAGRGQAGNNPFMEILSAINDVTSNKNPNIVTGEPTILPGKWDAVEALYKGAPTLYKLITEFPATARYMMTGRGYGKMFKDFFKNGNTSVLGNLERGAQQFENSNYSRTFTEVIPKGFVKGNEVTVNGMHPISEEGLTIRTARPFNVENPVTTAAEKQAAMDYAKETGIAVNTKLPTGKPPTTITIGDETIDIMYPFAKYKPTVKEVQLTVAKPATTAKVTLKERYADRKNYSKKIRTLDKDARSMELEDARPSNAGQSRVHNRQNDWDWELMKKFKEYEKEMVKIEKSMVKHAKGTPGHKEAMKRKKALLERFRKEKRFKLGGKIFGINNLGL